MTRIRTIRMSEALLKPILEARLQPSFPIDRGQAPADEQAAVAFGLPHPIHVLGLRDLLKRRGPHGAPAAVRIMECRGPEFSAFYDVSPSEGSPELLQMAAMDNDYGIRLERGMAVAHAWAENRKHEADLRLLRVPALYTEALLLRTKDEAEEVAIVIRTPHSEVDMLKPMPLPELLRRLEAPARLVLEHDDELKGS